MDAWTCSPPLPVPVDILLDIVAHLPLAAVLALRRTCKTLCAATHLRAVWAPLFRTHVLDQHIPYPDLGTTPLADLSARDLESLTRRALACRRAWTSPEPVPRRHITLSAPPDPRARVIFLQFLPGRSNRWLISVRMTARPSTYLLQCWDVARDSPRCVAELTHADGPYGGVVLNTDPSSPAVLAMQSAQTETFSIRFDAEDPESAFQTEATIDGIRELHLLAGATLVTRRIDDGGALCLWDLADLRRETLQLLNPSITQPDDRIQALHLAHDYALVVRVQSTEIYSTTPRPSLLSVQGAPVAYPLAQFKFQWRTDTVVLCEQHASPSPVSTPRPIHLLVRFGSIYPWPVNVLHHYLLLPNPTYHTGAPHGRIPRGCTPAPGLTRHPSPTGPTSTPSSYPPSPTSVASSSSIPASVTTTEYNLPYDPRPHPIRTIGSPVRLFGQSAMTLGRHGTALWLDNHTEEWLGPSERGQRLAGLVVPNSTGDGVGEMSIGGGGGAMTTTTTTSAGPNVPANTSGVSMVFGMRDDDAWTRVAMEEEAGRIALGHADGAITLMEY